ncbi:hypothetical protein CRE_08391 [Caenorhabditis remanei]|uniref:MRG domain-containing protein n=1 Tax=Caenorhabditis remanei TaxID=31234 RepID=E3MPH7_CAERE|nr:hypothetical protein CRE_08391 [Caenorhabditis remanei]
MEPLFEVGEVFVCLFEKQHPYEAKIIGMREERGVDHYVIHYIGWHKRHNEIIPFGEEEGKMFKGNLKQFAEEHPEIEIPADAHKGAKRGRAPNPKILEGETSVEKKDEGGEEEEVEKKKDEEEVEERVEDGREEVVGPVENVVEEEKVEKKKNEEIEEQVVDTVKDVGGPEEEVEVVEQVEKKPEKKAEKPKSKKKGKTNVVVNDQPPPVFPKNPVCLDALEPPLSNTLRDILVEDLDYVNKYFVTRLPVGVSVEDIMVEYKKHLQATKKRQLKQLRNPDIEKKKKEIIAETDKLLATANGIVPIFNAALGCHLLYTTERQQYNKVRKADAIKNKFTFKDITELGKYDFRPSEQYGMVHLLRMLTKLPELLQLSDWNDHMRIAIGLKDFVKFLHKNASKFFTGANEYTTLTAEYFRQPQTVGD